ncbi:MAG: iron ABC transporter permease, partial [Microvirga sp.]
FLLAFSELTVSALLWSAGTETIGVVLYNLEEAGLASQASAVAIVIIAVVTIAMLVLDALGKYLPAGALPWQCEMEGEVRMNAKPLHFPARAPAIKQLEPKPALS